jgi:hypothetical protein
MVTTVATRVDNLRKLASEMRKHASETEMPVYVELMLRTARQLEIEAARLERDGPFAWRTEHEREIRYIPPEHGLEH